MSAARHTQPLRVRVHLNLANHERAESAVRVQAPSGSWLTVAYATQLLLSDCAPVVKREAQERIRNGSSRKVPHAFIEGNLEHFVGRTRAKAPEALVAKASVYLVSNSAFVAAHNAPARAPINYNPRFAKCFYRDEAVREDVCKKLERCKQMVVVGWNFWARQAVFQPMTASDYC